MDREKVIGRVTKILDDKGILYEKDDQKVMLHTTNGDVEMDHAIIFMEPDCLMFVTAAGTDGVVDHRRMADFNAKWPPGCFVCMETEDSSLLAFKSVCLLGSRKDIGWKMISRHCLLGAKTVAHHTRDVLWVDDGSKPMYGRGSRRRTRGDGAATGGRRPGHIL